MPGKGEVEAGSALTNKFRLEIIGGPNIYFSRVGEEAMEIKMAKMPDYTMQTTGQSDAIETEVDIMPHHEADRVYMEAWIADTLAGGPTHKRAGIMHHLGANDQPVFSHFWDGVVNRGRKRPEMNKGSDGEALVLTYSLTIDAILPV